jgi:hypothetical protein
MLDALILNTKSGVFEKIKKNNIIRASQDYVLFKSTDRFG